MSELEKIYEANIENKDFIEQFKNHIISSDMIPYDSVKDWIGYKKKQTITDILRNKRYGYIENVDYRIVKEKKENICKPVDEIYMTIDTIKCICLTAPTEQSQQFRKYYIEMEKLFKKYISENIRKTLKNPIPDADMYDIDVKSFEDKEVFYLIYIGEGHFKYGITYDIRERLNTHRGNLDYKYVVKLWNCVNRTISKRVEDGVKSYFVYNNRSLRYKNNTEVFALETKEEIKKMTDLIDKYVDIEIKKYNNANVSQELILRNQIMDKKIEYVKLLLSGNVDNKEHLIKEINCIELKDDTLDNIKPEIKNEDIKDDIKLETKNNEDVLEEEKKDIDLKVYFLRKCKKCPKKLTEKEFGLNGKIPCVNCPECREKGRIQDKKRLKDKMEKQKDIDLRKYYKDNRESILQKKKDYYIKNKEHILERNRVHSHKDEVRDKILSRKKRYYGDNKEEVLDRSHKYYRKNAEKIKEDKKTKRINKKLIIINDE